MVYKPSNSRYYRVKFRWKGEPINRPTRCLTKSDARKVEAKIRSELALGNFGILEPKTVPTLASFLVHDFSPYVRTKHKEKQKTVDYYEYGAKSLAACHLGLLKLDELTDQHARQFEAMKIKRDGWAASTVNCCLRTLRHSLKVAEEWGRIARSPKITLAKGENQRDRVVSHEEFRLYLAACAQPWRDAALVMYNTALRPNEVFTLRWENIALRVVPSTIRVIEGKSKAAKRLVPMVPELHQVMSSRHQSQELPSTGWVFPTQSESGHLDQGTAKGQHQRALKKLVTAQKAFRAATSAGEDWVVGVVEATGLPHWIVRSSEAVLKEGIAPFEPYCLRHTALTRFAPHMDSFALARVAGHSSITITQRYCHPQADTIAKAFAILGQQSEVVIEGGNTVASA
jgi:integrase